MVVLGGGAVSYERGTPVGGATGQLADGVQEGRCKATWKREFKLPWRVAGPPNHHDDKVDSDQ